VNKRILPLAIVVGLAGCLAAPAAMAIPVFARQTGQNCNACHVSFPELTPYGRYFKLSGYTLGKRVDIPLAMMGQVGVTKTNHNTLADGTEVDPDDGKLKLEAASLFVGGKATDHLGGFIQWTYDGIAHHSNVDNTDLRLVNEYVAPGGKEPDLIYGLDVNNNPTVEDIWNSTPAWGFPYTTSSTGVTGVPFATLIDGGLAQLAAGVGGYVFWKQTIYFDLTAYRTADGPFSAFRAGVANADRISMQGYNPYWRLAYNKQWGPDSFEIGTYGIVADLYPDASNPNGPTNKYTDTAVDAQYQHITDVHTYSGQITYIHEKTDWDASYQGGTGTSNSSDHLNTLKAKASYWYQHKYGATVAYFTTTGSSDSLLYDPDGPGSQGESQNGSPDTTGYILEADYMPRDDVRIMLQYTGYTKYLGSSSNYDGTGRSASDNNSLFLNLWFAF
jgi:hypothetical protein